MTLYRWRRRLVHAWEGRRDGRIVSVALPTGVTFRWVYNHRYPPSMASGTYEVDLVNALLSTLHEGDCFLDVGANAGYFSICAKLAVGAGRVVAFEPLPENIRMIRAVQAANPDQAFELVEAAVSDSDGAVSFDVTRNNANSRLSHVQWELAKAAVDRITVKSLALKPFIQRYRPAAVKVDTEGAEVLILSALGSPQEWGVQPVFFLEFHGADNYWAARPIIAGWGYDLYSLDGRPAPDGVSEQFVIAKPRPSRPTPER